MERASPLGPPFGDERRDLAHEGVDRASPRRVEPSHFEEECERRRRIAMARHVTGTEGGDDVAARAAEGPIDHAADLAHDA